MALVMGTALVTGLVVANWTGTESDWKLQGSGTPRPAVSAVSSRSPGQVTPPLRRAVQTAVPPLAAVEECNRAAAQQTAPRDETMAVVKDAAVGAVVGAAVGAAGGAIADGGKGAGKGAAIGGVVGAGAGTLYGLHENRKHDQRYRDAYAACMRARGYTS
jgi:hypothetical protein